jgi:putative ABC transport system permease protein
MAIPLKYNLRNLMVRKVSTLMVVVGTALVVVIFVGIMAVVDGIERMYQAGGEADNLIVLRKGASDTVMSALPPEVYQTAGTLPEVATNERGEPLISREMDVSVSLPARDSQADELVIVRGVDPIAFDVHRRVKLVSGEGPRRGNGVMLGRLAAEQLGGLRPGDQISFGQSVWTVAGIFEAPGTVFDSEIWADRRDLMLDTRREQVTDLVLKLKDPQSVGPVARRLTEDKRIAVTAKSESRYLMAAEAESLLGQLGLLGSVLAFFMALGGALGGMNLMYTAVSARTREIGMLFAMGFSKRSVLTSFLLELLVVTTAGGLLGVVVALAVRAFSLRLSVGGRLISFSPHVAPETLLWGLLIAVVIGVAGGFLPALSAARLKVVDALRSF